MYEISSSNRSFQVKPSDSLGSGSINDKDYSIDVKQIDDKTFHIIKDHKSYNVEIVKADYKSKEFHIKVNNTDYQFKAKDQFDLLLKELGMESVSNTKVNELKAPMPGLVLDILVNPGDTVSKGDGLIVLEAMKMENILKSPADVVIKSIEVERTNAVEKNTILIKFE